MATSRAPVAAIDIGTNSVRLLIVGPGENALERHMHITRLGQGVDATGHLDPEAMERTLRVLADYATRCRSHAISALRMSATSAARDAKNRDEFFRRVRELVGSEPELLSGDVEAALSFSGATAQLADDHESFVVADIGGGSTELALGGERPRASISLDVGSVRLTEKFFTSDPPAVPELSAAERFVRDALSRARDTLRPVGNELWIGVAGTVTSLAAMALGLEHHEPQRTHGYVLGARAARAAFEHLRSAPLSERRGLLIQPERAEVIVGGALILACIFDDFELDSIIVSEKDILDALAASLLVHLPEGRCPSNN